MAYVQGFENDIFVSCARVDNGKAKTEKYGWIALFYEQLDIELSKLVDRR